MAGRAIVITESFRGGALPPALRTLVVRTYQHSLGGLPVTIAEAIVPRAILGQTLLELSGELRPEGFYAHIWTKEELYVCFPDVIVRVPKDDSVAARQAQTIGSIFGIPLAQMRFLEMQTVDHPDA